MSEKKRSKRGIIITLKILASTIIIIAILLIGIRVGEKFAFASFYNSAKRELPIPGVNGGFVGQGLDYIEDKEVFITCGYSAKKGEASSVYVMNADGSNRKCELKNADGSVYVGHTGGVAHYKDYCYITGADGCDVFALSDILTKSEAKKIGEIKSPTGHDPAYVTVHDGKLYEGSFYRAGNYETPDNERITTPCGDENTALIYVYDLDDSAPFGVNETPVAAYSTTGLVQGMCFTDTQIVLSTSYGLAPSRLKYYDLSRIPQPVEKTIGSFTLDFYYLDGSCLERDVTAPPMSEEIVYKDGRIFIMTESASDKYIFGKFMSGRYMYSYAQK